MDLFTLVAKLAMDTSEFESGVSKSKGLFSNLGNTVSAATVAMGNLMAKGVEKGIEAIINLGKAGIEYNAQMEDYTTNFAVMLGSQEAAVQKVESLKEMAAKTPFEMSDLASATQTLLAFGIESENVEGIMKMLGDVSLGNSQKFSSLATVFGQVSSTGKLMGQDLMQMINQGFNPLQVIADKTGASVADLKNVMGGTKTSKEFQQMVKAAKEEVKKLGDGASDSAKMLAQIGDEGVISADMVTQAFEIATSEGGQFFNGMEASSQTFNGMMSTLSDNWNSLVGDVFKPVSDYMTSTLLPAAIDAVDKLSEAYDTGGLVGMAQAVKDIVGPYISSAFETVKNAAQGAIDTGANVLAGIYNGLTGGDITGEDVKFVFSEMWGKVKEYAQTVVDAGSSVIGDIYSALTGDTATGEKIKETIRGVFEDPVGAITGLVEKGKTLFSDLYDAVSGDAEAQESIKATFENVFGNVRSFFDDAATQAGALFGKMAEALTGDSEGAESIKEAFATAFDDPMQTVQNIITAGGSMVASIAEFLGADEESVESIRQSFVDMATDPLATIESVVAAGSAILSKITQAFLNPESRAAFFESVKGAFQEAVDYISSLPAQALEWGKSLIDNFVNGLLEKWEALKAKVSSLASGIKSLFPSSGGSSSSSSGSYAVGLDYVPYNDYPATLHRGEAVLTRSEAEEWRSGEKSSGGVTVIQNIYAQEMTAAELMQEAYWQQERAVLYSV